MMPGQLRQVSDRQRHKQARSNLLNWLTVHSGEGGPQDLMAAHNLVDAAFQDVHVYRERQRHRYTLVVKGAPLRQLIQHPDPPLSV
jgi:hypothetical protein